jgi:hypothetical protein
MQMLYSEITQDNDSIVYASMAFRRKGKRVLAAELGGKQFDAKNARVAVLQGS